MEAIGRRRKREKNYVTIENAMFHDERISWKAKGLLGYLLTKPDGWKVQIKDLMNHGTEGERAIRTGLKELKDFGYLSYYRTKRSDGKFKGIIWEYDDIPFEPDSLEIVITEPFEPQLQNSNVDENEENEPQLQNANVESVDVQNHPCITKKDFTNHLLVKNNKKLASLDDMNSVDLILKKIFPEVPFEEIKEKVIDEALQGKVLIDTKNRYRGLLNSRIEDWKRSKQPNKPYTRSKQIHHKEILPEWFDEEEAASKASENKPELSPEQKKEWRDILADFRNK